MRCSTTAPPTDAVRLVRVAVPVPSLDALTYSLPDSFPDPVPGARVLVPLRNRVMTGCVVPGNERNQERSETRDGDDAPDTDSTSAAVKPILDVLDTEPFLPPEVIQLVEWVAEYYACGLGEALAAAMPPRAWIESDRHARITDAGQMRLGSEGGQRRALLEALAPGKPVRVASLARAGRGTHRALMALERDGLVALTNPLKGRAFAYRTARMASLTAQGLDVASSADPGADLRLGPRQREALDLLRAAPDGLDATVLAKQGIGGASLGRLAALGLVAIDRRRIDRDPFVLDPFGEPVPIPDVVLTNEQRAALTQLEVAAAAGTFAPVLLHGVTGSGKTELYLRLAARVCRAGRGVIMLVPEIALTPAVAVAFRRTFGERVAIQHSGLSDGERHDQWQRIRTGAVDVVVGTRSAVFAPVKSLGLVIVDEEHDSSYKQEETPRYQGRDVAVMRARQAAAVAVLGSATPSMESYHNALNGRYALVTLENRILDRPLADVRIVNMRDEYAQAGPDLVLSQPLCDAVDARLSQGEQAILLLNRRGFAASVLCRQCGETLECPNCSVSLTVHRAAHRARCHYCNYSMAVPRSCAKCAGPYLEQIGFGTERVETEVRDRFPAARVARLDRDTIRRRGAVATLLARFAAGEIDVLIGTQMVAKGHDFPRVTLVGVVSADVGLGHADFRASERTFQLLTQVAGRAGRGDIRGEALIQTLFPEHYSIRFACRQDYPAFYKEEIAYRRAMRYPPAIALINAIVKGRSRAEAMQDAGTLVQALRWGGESYRVLGPAPAPLSRLKGEYRAQFFMKGTHRGEMRKALLKVLESKSEIRRRTIVDVDPMSVL